MLAKLPDPADPEGSTEEWREAHTALLDEVSSYNAGLSRKSRPITNLVRIIEGIAADIRHTAPVDVYSDLPCEVLKRLIPDYDQKNMDGENITSDLEISIESRYPVRRILFNEGPDIVKGDIVRAYIFAAKMSRFRSYAGRLCRLKQDQLQYVFSERELKETEIAVVIDRVVAAGSSEERVERYTILD